MFEHFGMRDVFSALKRYFALVLVIILIALMFGGVSGILKIKHANASGSQKEASEFYISTASYSVKPLVTPTDENLGVYRELPSQFAHILQADFCKNYVFKEITKEYSAEELIQKTILKKDPAYVKPQDLTMYCLEKLFYSQQYENTMVVQLIVETYDEQLSRDLLSAYQTFLTQQYAPTVSTAQLTFLDNINHNIVSDKSIVSSLVEAAKDSTKKATTNPTATVVNPVKVMIKSMGVSFILGVAFSCLLIFVIALFQPTLNRKSDFFEYDVPVIGELHIYDKPKERN